jgi:hypothetical protein
MFVRRAAFAGAPAASLGGCVSSTPDAVPDPDASGGNDRGRSRGAGPCGTIALELPPHSVTVLALAMPR